MKEFTLSFLLVCGILLNLKAQQSSTGNDSLLLDYYQNQRFAEAADYLKKTYPEPVTNIKVLSKLAYTSQMAGKLPDAEGYYQRMYDIDSTNNAVLFSLGGINLRRGNNLKAELYYKILSRKDTTNFLVFKQLSKICLDKGDLPGMLVNLQKANKINPAEPDVAADLSDMYVTFKQYDTAEKVLNEAINQDPDNINLLQSLLKLTYSQKKFEAVKSTCLKLIQLGSGNGFVLTKLGAAYYNLKDYTCSVETFAGIGPMEQSETSFYIAALAYKALKDQPKAIENLGKAIDAGISTNISDYYAEMADSYEIRKKYQKAILAYQKGLQFTEKPIIYYLLATIYDSDIKNKKLAVKYYKKYMASKPPVKEEKYLAYSRSRVTELANSN
ncbi:tetratricopeptide repeat protein [Mucilaginibacter sp.]|uniref:tetratricopeptide repeat protein n=1 Tax=Mucilaginibacter sp. TaxID=1882438 RepID=UPI0026354EFE|nr:tetratricopeptide repeat protein [Mucilaginibacter sp.]MDB4924530.1 hypothetical protein [Mucilaginibacter sp.]